MDDWIKATYVLILKDKMDINEIVMFRITPKRNEYIPSLQQFINEQQNG